MAAQQQQPPSVSDLVFAADQANHNFSRILGDLRRANLGIGNRLRSAREDAEFVTAAAASLGRPLVANERCGSWYVEPMLKAASAYFKSTDGHAGQWCFSTRRLNLHLLPLIGRSDGCIIVDSTRRGKRIPDALSKTVPIWCCVLNRVLLPELSDVAHDLHVPPQAVSDSERSQMLARVPEFVASLERLGLDLPSLRSHLRKPLRPMWLNHPDEGPFSSVLPPPPPPEDGGDDGRSDGRSPKEIFADSHPIVCCTSSRRVPPGAAEMSGSGYVQGAGDDTENWAHGLTPPVFWANADRLLATPEPDLPPLIRSLVADAEDEARRAAHRAGTIWELTPFLSVSPLPPGAGVGQEEPGDKGDADTLSSSPPPEVITTISLLPKVTKPETWTKSSTTLEVGVGRGKIASRNLRQALPDICAFVQKRQQQQQQQQTPDGAKVKVLVACETGRDLSVGVALVLACRCFDEKGNVLPADQPANWPGPTKDSIRTKLGRIVTAMPEANPSRATLQSVNSFLMDWRG